MKLLFSLIFISLCHISSFSQNNYIDLKNRFYIYWGWNWSWYTKSNIHFTGAGYDFTLEKVRAKDRQSPFNFNTYFTPKSFTIPQYNYRLGYFINQKYDISFGMDHMKYVVTDKQEVSISGHIENSNTHYDGTYQSAPIQIVSRFLSYEHTDGLNFANLEIRRTDSVFAFSKIKLSVISGAGFGLLIPKTNSKLLGKERYDEFHLSGYGIDALLGLNITFFKHFFAQSEFKGGFLNMPVVRTTSSTTDKAKQSFFFSQLNIAFGGRFRF